MAKAAKEKPGAPRLALVGGDSLAGRELRDILSSGRLASQVDLFGDGTPATSDGTDDDAEPLLDLSAEALHRARVVLLAGSPDSCRIALDLAPKSAPLIDLTGTLPGSVRAPAAEPERYLPPESRVIVIAHPAAILLASFLRRLPLRPFRSVAQIFLPASEWGKTGVVTLQQQTVGLLNFRPLEKEPFDEQISFNLLSRFGTESPRDLAPVEERIRRDVTRLLTLDPFLAVPSLRLIQAPVFHGCAASIWVEFEEPANTAELTEALRPHSDLRPRTEEPPSNVSIAGQSGFSLDEPLPDKGNPRAVWFWLLADNLRLTADNAMLTAASILEQAARRVQ